MFLPLLNKTKPRLGLLSVVSLKSHFLYKTANCHLFFQHCVTQLLFKCKTAQSVSYWAAGEIGLPPPLSRFDAHTDLESRDPPNLSSSAGEGTCTSLCFSTERLWVSVSVALSGLKQKPSYILYDTTLSHMPCKHLKTVRAPPTWTKCSRNCLIWAQMLAQSGCWGWRRGVHITTLSPQLHTWPWLRWETWVRESIKSFLPMANPHPY